MSKVTNTNFSAETENRILIWQEALHKAYSNIEAKQHIESNIETANSDCRFILANSPCYVHTSFAASEALINYSIILIWQVFTSGDAGSGIENNHGNIELDNFRISMIKYVKEKLNWSEEVHQNFKALIRNNRNELVAHYSGRNAGYEVISPDLSSRKMVGSHISNADIEKMKIYVEAMCCYIEETLLPIS